MLMIPNILTPFNSIKTLPFRSLWSYGHVALYTYEYLLYYYFTTLLKPHLCPDGAVAPLPRALNAPFPDFSYHYYSAFRIHHVFLHHHCPSHTNSVESQDNQSTALFDMRHLNNRTIFLHLCVFVVPLSCHKRLLLHWAMILNPLLIYVAASYTLVLTLIFSPNVFLYSYLSPSDCRHLIPLNALTRSYNESRHLIARTTTQAVSPFDSVQHYHYVATWYRMSTKSPIDINFLMLLIPNILTPFNSKDSAVSKKYLLVAIGLIVTEI